MPIIYVFIIFLNWWINKTVEKLLIRVVKDLNYNCLKQNTLLYYEFNSESTCDEAHIIHTADNQKRQEVTDCIVIIVE